MKLIFRTSITQKVPQVSENNEVDNNGDLQNLNTSFVGDIAQLSNPDVG